MPTRVEEPPLAGAGRLRLRGDVGLRRCQCGGQTAIRSGTLRPAKDKRPDRFQSGRPWTINRLPLLGSRSAHLNGPLKRKAGCDLPEPRPAMKSLCFEPEAMRGTGSCHGPSCGLNQMFRDLCQFRNSLSSAAMTLRHGRFPAGRNGRPLPPSRARHKQARTLSETPQLHDPLPLRKNDRPALFAAR